MFSGNDPNQHIQGIEGNNILFYIKLFGADAENLPKDVWFIPLNDHYNCHDAAWSSWTLERAKTSRAVIFYDMENSSDWDHPRFVEFMTEFPHQNKIYLTTNHSMNLYIPGVQVFRWDFMWNRFKAYYTEKIPLELKLHHYAGPHRYKLTNLDSVPTKKFLSLCGKGLEFRTRLYNVIKDRGDGYISNMSQGKILELTENEALEPIWAYTPVPGRFYEDSCISVYVESSCECADLIFPTEKTFEPLIKGHFILPFGNSGLVERILEMGFKLPDFIDYSYDSIVDVEARFKMYIDEVHRLLNYVNIFDMHRHHSEMRKVNRECLYNIPYDTSILKVFNV